MTKNNQIISLRLPEKLNRDLEQLAEETNDSKTNLIRQGANMLLLNILPKYYKEQAEYLISQGHFHDVVDFYTCAARELVDKYNFKK